MPVTVVKRDCTGKVSRSIDSGTIDNITMVEERWWVFQDISRPNLQRLSKNKAMVSEDTIVKAEATMEKKAVQQRWKFLQVMQDF